MNKSGLSNSGDLTVVRLDRREYDAQDELTGTVELSNPHRKEISSITLELTTWRHLTLPKCGKNHVEQVSLSRFPPARPMSCRRLTVLALETES